MGNLKSKRTNVKSYQDAVELIANLENYGINRVYTEDERTGNIYVNGSLVERFDVETIELLCDLEQNQIHMQKRMVEDAIKAVAYRNKFNPVKTYLQSLKWDGVPRFDRIFDTIHPIGRQMIHKWFISAVARALKPGCQVDSVLILVGNQGKGKTSFFRILGGEWFTNTFFDFTSKDSLITVSSNWIIEFGELSVYRNAKDVEAIKNFLTTTVDNYRAPYDRGNLARKRPCVFVGTTNDTEFLRDVEDRRYWPVTIEKIDTEFVKKYRDQIWAEAVSYFKAGETWWFDEDEQQKVNGYLVDYKELDPWTETVMEYIEGKDRVSTRDIRTDLSALGIEVGKATARDDRRIAKILRLAGWRVVHTKKGNMWECINVPYQRPTEDEPTIKSSNTITTKDGEAVEVNFDWS